MNSPAANSIAGKVVPPLLLTYFGIAWYKCNVDVIPWLRSRHSSWSTASYGLVANAGIPFLLWTYLYLLRLPKSDSTPPTQPPEPVLARKIVFQCHKPESATPDDEGHWAVEADQEVILDRCWRDGCAGRWKPPKTRHCGTCKRCKVGFDHHCPWFDNCLTVAHIRSFLHLTIMTPLVIFYLVLPVFPTFWSQARQVLSASARAPFFQTWTSWIIFGGPVGRWAMMLAFGYWRDTSSGGQPKGMMVGPSGTLAVLVLMGIGFSLICMGLAYGTTSHVLRGELEVDSQRRKAYNALAAQKVKYRDDQPQALLDAMARLDPGADVYLFVPSEAACAQEAQSDPRKGHIVKARAGPDPYDQGSWRRNWDMLVGPGWDAVCPQFLVGARPIPLPWPIRRDLEEQSHRMALVERSSRTHADP